MDFSCNIIDLLPWMTGNGQLQLAAIGTIEGGFWIVIKKYVMPAIVAAISVFIFLGAKFILKRQGRGKNDWAIIQQIALFLIANIGLIAVILTLPMDSTMRGQITQLLGIVISAMIALSSATLIGNMFAGILLRFIGSFKPGDFIEVNEHFGRISERGLFHTELQTIDSDLITLPNLYLVTHAVKVKRSTGTFISAKVSLGYDVSRIKAEKSLIQAAENTDLEDVYVNITALEDYSVVYEVHGKLNDVKKIISTRSLLRAKMLDALHEARIEIVSPSFMNQRQITEKEIIPQKTSAKIEDKQVSANPEDQIFDKAEKAESIEKRKQRMDDLDEKIKQLQGRLKESTSPEEKEDIQSKIDKSKELKENILSNIVTAKEKLDKES